MQLDAIRIHLRQRSAWEAIDLGLSMVHAWAKPIYKAWFCSYVLFALILLILCAGRPSTATWILWWLKPFFDRIILKIVAEATIGTPPSLSEIRKSIPSIFKKTGLFGALTWRRFSTQRSFDLPLWQLEGSSKNRKDFNTRRRILARRCSGHAFWLTFVCSNCLAILEISFIVFATWFIPGSVMTETSFSLGTLMMDGFKPWQEVMVFFSLVLAESIIEPFYVAAGFSLYLNRRNDLEAWDIEQHFKKMEARLTQTPSYTPSTHNDRPAECPHPKNISTQNTEDPEQNDLSKAKSLTTPPPQHQSGYMSKHLVILLATCLCLGFIFFSAQGNASEHTASNASPPASTKPNGKEPPVSPFKQSVLEILKDPLFGHKETVKAWRPIPKKHEANKKNDMPAWLKALGAYGELIATILRVLIYLVAVCFLIFLVYQIIIRNPHWFNSFNQRSTIPDQLFGLDLRPSSLPDDIGDTALQLVLQNKNVEALSLLYRGTLVALIGNYHIRFVDGDTEHDCLNKVHGCIPDNSMDYFNRLLKAWSATAYAHQHLLADPLKDLCATWGQHFSIGKNQS